MKWAKALFHWFSAIVILSAFAQAQDSFLRITSPEDQSTVFAGQTLKIRVAADPSVQNLLILGQYPLPEARPTGNPGEFAMKLPTNVSPGLYQFGAVGTVPGQPVFSRPVQIQLERRDLPIGLKTLPVAVLTVGDRDPIELHGEYSDGAKLYLSYSTQVYGKSINPAIATIDEERPLGDPIRIKAISPGKTVIVLSIGHGPSSSSAAVFVTVNEPPPSGPAPVITGVSTNIGTPGLTQVIVDGENFGESPKGRDYLQLGNMSATKILKWTPTQIVAVVPLGSMPGVVEVGHNRLQSNDVPFQTVVPEITDVTPRSGVVGQRVIITGKNFGAAQGTSTLRFNIAMASPITWSDASIVTTVPVDATTGSVVIFVNEAPANGGNFIAKPTIASISPEQGQSGSLVKISGSSFGPVQGTSIVTFNGISAPVISWDAGFVMVRVPAGATSGPVIVRVNEIDGNAGQFTIEAR